MVNQQKNHTEGKKDKKRFLLAILLLLAALLLISGIVIAYFSDFITGGGNFESGTLDIEGTYVFYVNDELVESADDLQNLNPGDAVTIIATISNLGSKSAWVRERISLTAIDPAILDYIEVYSGQISQADLLAGTDLSGSVLPLTDNVAVSPNRVLNGSAENESGGPYTYIGATSYTVTITVYFSHLAGNDAQGKSFGLSITTQALQFRNNNAAEPNESAWQTVLSAGQVSQGG